MQARVFVDLCPMTTKMKTVKTLGTFCVAYLTVKHAVVVGPKAVIPPPWMA